VLGALAQPVAAQAPAEGFASMGSDAAGYAAVLPETTLTFPEDHYPHPDFRIEWWYVTATLTGNDGEDYGAQFTLFRYRTDPDAEGEGWESPQFWMGHAAATSAETHRAAERLARGDVGQAGVARPFEAWIDDWSLASTAPPGTDPFERMTLRAGGDGFSYDLAMTAEQPLVLHGRDGFSVKSDRGHASHYYSQTAFAVTGTLSIDGRTVTVTGNAWLDREWSSQPLDADQTGWDWFSLHFDDGSRLMVYRLRMDDGSRSRTVGTHVAFNGTVTPLEDGSIEMQPLGYADVEGRETPVRWRIDVPDLGVAIETQPLNAQSWNDLSVPYWEGPVYATGSHQGRGYLEMTGY
jgi:predicted secreted hydrolase